MSDKINADIYHARGLIVSHASYAGSVSCWMINSPKKLVVYIFICI